jgi:hypothetical protein
MKTLPKFLICRNEAAQPGIIYIVHSQDPPFIATVRKFSSLDEIESFKQNVGHTNYYCLPDHLLGIEVVHFFTEFTQMPRRFNLLMKRALNWYIHAQADKEA